MSTGSDFTRFRMGIREKIEQLERKNAELRAENIKLRERIAFEASMNAQLKEKLENKTNSSN
jgi:regulator of replication initiation timing